MILDDVGVKEYVKGNDVDYVGLKDSVKGNEMRAEQSS